jgi:hypothetical protein
MNDELKTESLEVTSGHLPLHHRLSSHTYRVTKLVNKAPPLYVRDITVVNGRASIDGNGD